MKQLILPAILLLSVAAPGTHAINIVVDYTYDTNNFFDTQNKKDAMQAVADRYSRVITSSLAAVSPSGTSSGTSAGWRIGFSHPGTGASFQISTAASSGSDPLGGSGAADVYGFAGLNADEWKLFAGGRALSSAGIGGTGTGLNFTSTFNDESGPLHRGFMDNTPSNTVNDLPRWGGGISFDTGRTWHFDLATTATTGTLDFYSIALHEVGHALGLSTSWNQWADDGSGNYVGATAIAAYNADNGTSATSLNLVSASDNHWEDGTYDSLVFSLGGAVTVGTVPTGTLQDLLMEPIANFSSSVNRFELTNADVGALQDLGWMVVPEPGASALIASGLLVFARRRRTTARQ